MKNIMVRMLVCAALVSSALPAAAARYNFSQDGFTSGGRISGWFEGVDLDGDGQLCSFCGNEVTDYFVSFSGNAIIAPFSHNFSQLGGLVYNLGSHYLGDEGDRAVEGIASNWNNSGLTGIEYASGVGPTSSVGGYLREWNSGQKSTTLNLVEVAAVPEPETYAMLLAGLGVVGWSLRKRQR